MKEERNNGSRMKGRKEKKKKKRERRREGRETSQNILYSK